MTNTTMIYMSYSMEQMSSLNGDGDGDATRRRGAAPAATQAQTRASYTSRLLVLVEEIAENG